MKSPLLACAAALTASQCMSAADLFWNPSPLSDSWENTVWASTPGGAPALAWTSGDNAIFDRDGVYTVTLGPSIVWGTTTLSAENFFATGNLSLAGPNATDTCTFTSDIDLNAANRTVSAVNGTAEVDGVFSGVISGASGSILSKSGTGVILLSNANAHPGGTTIAPSQGAGNPLRISNANALGTGSLNLGGGGNNDQARLELTGDITVTNNIPILTSRNNDAANFLNISGENTITSNINSGGGGNRVTLQSNEGNLIFTGSIGTRQLNLRGDGNGELRGNIPLQGTHGLNKAGAGTWIVAGAATYAGTTVISEGTLQVGDGGTSGTLPAGDLANDGELVFNRDGELAVAAAISGGGNLTKRGPGSVTLSGPTIGHTGTTLVEDGALLITGDATNATGIVTVGDSIGLAGTAIFGGIGPIGGNIVLASDGAIAPGETVGTLSVSGSVSGAGGLNIEMNGETADKLVVHGSLGISGLKLNVTTPGNPTKPVYVIVDASSPITGAEFASKSGLPGDYQVVYNYNDGIDSHNIALVGTPVSDPFESWSTLNGLAGAAAAADADPDQDGLDNGVEFVLGGQPNPANPGASSSALTPVLSVNDNYLIFTYRRTDLAMSQPGIGIGVEYGSDLAGWTPAEASPGGILINVTDEGYFPMADKSAMTPENRPIRWNYTINGGGSRLPFAEDGKALPGIGNGWSRPLMHLTDPSRTVMLAEGTSWWLNAEAKPGSNRIRTWTNGTANILWCDGSLQLLNPRTELRPEHFWAKK